MIKNLLILCMIAVALSTQSCKKKDGMGSVTPPVDSVAIPSKLDLLRDSIYLYTEEVYLWHEVLPSYVGFNPRQYTGTTDLQAAKNEMAAIRALQPEDNRHSYSFVTTTAGSNAIQTGEDQDYGFFIKAGSVNKALSYDSVHWYVEYVYKNSPSGVAGVQRGWYITKINNSSIGYDNASVKILNDVFFGTGSTANFEFTKSDGSTVNVNLNKSAYTANSVLYTNVFTNGSTKTGYIVFNQFFGEVSRTELAKTFSDFASQGINELVVDLRYNHGGSTDTQNALADLIAPSSADGKTMYTYIYNDSLQAGKFHLLSRKYNLSATSFKPVNNTVKVQKTGSLNLSRVFFIVSHETASASELLINNLRPYLDVKLLGDTTYGKPVGFFPIPIFEYAIYPISFKTVNSVGSAEYYDGFAPDKLTPDGINKNWGDLTEPSLASALRFITTGSFNGRVFNQNVDVQDILILNAQKAYEPLNSKLYEKKFIGMFQEKK